MSYKKEHLCWMLQNGRKRQIVSIVAKNGKSVAECNTESMADKIIRGLKLVAAEDKAKAEFRI